MIKIGDEKRPWDEKEEKGKKEKKKGKNWGKIEKR